MFRRILVIAALALPAGQVWAQEIDPALGKRVAETNCAECHNVDRTPSAASPNSDASRFADIARIPSMTDLSIRVFLRTPHKSMPNVMLSADEIESLANYIMSMGKR